MERIIECKGTHFDPAVVDAFIRIAPLMRNVPATTEVAEPVVSGGAAS